MTGDVNAEKSTFPTKYSLHLLLCIHFIYFQISKLIGNRSGSSFFFCRADLGENGLYISFFLDVDLLFVWRASRNTARPLLTFFLLLVMSTVYINNKRRDILFFFIFNFFFFLPLPTTVWDSLQESWVFLFSKLKEILFFHAICAIIVWNPGYKKMCSYVTCLVLCITLLLPALYWQSLINSAPARLKWITMWCLILQQHFKGTRFLLLTTI